MMWSDQRIVSSNQQSAKSECEEGRRWFRLGALRMVGTLFVSRYSLKAEC